jgi:hypothetical protein
VEETRLQIASYIRASNKLLGTIHQDVSATTSINMSKTQLRSVIYSTWHSILNTDTAKMKNVANLSLTALALAGLASAGPTCTFPANASG